MKPGRFEFGLCVATAMLALSAMGPQAARAQNPPASFPQARPAEAACAREGVGLARGRPTVVHPRAEADLTCSVTPMEALEWLDAADTVFVDTRLPAEYGQFGVRGAVNLPVDDLPAKGFLKRKRVVLLGSGKGDQSLFRACARLKREGFGRVHVIRGGVMLWHLTQQPMIGRPPHPYALAALNPAEFWREGQFDENIVMHVPDMKAVEEHVPFAVELSGASTEGVRAVLQRRSQELKGAPLHAVVLVTGTEVTSAHWEAIQQRLWPIPVLHYSGGIAALAAAAAQQAAAWDAMARGPKTPACGS